MVRQEIIAGLNNAVSRGESIEKAVQSMISAGYSPDDVKEASGYINMGTLGRINAPEPSEPHAMPEAQEIQQAYAQEAEQPQAEAQQYQKLPSAPMIQEKPKSKRKMWMIILAVLLVLIIGGIALLMIFGESILSALFPKA